MTTNEPLASKIRPKNLKEFIGQDHLVGNNKPLRVAIDKQHLFSMIFWGPPGVGKTTLSKIYTQSLNVTLIELSAVSANKDDVRRAIKKAEDSDAPTVLFLDEIHRFNKAQQDFLLPFVESGILTLIGATTENPSFEVISPLLSRCRVFILNEINEKDMEKIIDRCVKGLSTKASIGKKAKGWLVSMANGDARQAITMIENTFNLYQSLKVEDLKNTLQSKHLRFDKKGEEHYNTISAFIKSMRASQPDAAIYYLSRMIDAGEDPIFIARRMVIFASEDIGLAQPTALVVANAVFKACQTIGYPECAINLAHGVAYLAQAKKSRAAYDALRSAQRDIKIHGNLPIPLKIRNAPTKLMSAEGRSCGKKLDYGKGYQMYTSDSLLPEKLKNKKYIN